MKVTIVREPSSVGNLNSIYLPLSNKTGTIALTSDTIGVGQTWRSVERFPGTTYTNNTGKPIMVSVYSSGRDVRLDFYINNSVVLSTTDTSAESGVRTGLSIIVPKGSNYKLTRSSKNGDYTSWFELR